MVSGVENKSCEERWKELGMSGEEKAEEDSCRGQRHDCAELA